MGPKKKTTDILSVLYLYKDINIFIVNNQYLIIDLFNLKYAFNICFAWILIKKQIISTSLSHDLNLGS